jgi:Gpi18-like mannosyltransferase
MSGGVIGKHWRKALLIATALVVALAIRWSLLDFISGDVRYWVSYWYSQLNQYGLSAFRAELPNDDGWAELRGSYPPTYYYLLWIATFFNSLAPSLYLIKAVSVSFDFVAAFFAFKIARLHPDGSAHRPWIAFFAVLFAPTLVANGAFWGQCDSIHTSLLLGAIYFSLVQRPFWVITFFTMALSVKAQAVFLLPYLLVLILRSRLRWAHLGLIPVVYTVVMLPAVLLGRPPLEILSIYLNQADFLRGLSLNAANPYYFISNDYYTAGVVIGTAIAIAASLLFAWRASQSRRATDNEFLLLCATFSLAMAPFLLPKMHDRYFLAADLSSIVLAVYCHRLWFIPIGFQVTSGLAYIPVVSDVVTDFGGEVLAFMPLAAALNFVLMVLFTVVYLRETGGYRREEKMRQALTGPVGGAVGLGRSAQ